jgi:accessory gene regulator B
MNFIDRAAESIAQSIRRNNPNAGSEVALKYASSLLINTLTAITAALLISMVTGHFYSCLIGIVSFTLVRFVSGGMHMSTSVSCCVLSIVIFITASYVNFDYSSIFILMDITSIIILMITAPNDIKNVSSIDPKYYPLLKLIAVVLVASNFWIQSSVLTAAFIIEAFLTTTLAYKLRDLIEGGDKYEN